MGNTESLARAMKHRYDREPIDGVVHLSPGPEPENCTHWDDVPDAPDSIRLHDECDGDGGLPADWVWSGGYESDFSNFDFGSQDVA